MKTETFKKGFTLAELLTAIAIIAILIGILMPALNMAKKLANDTKQKAQLSSIETGVIMYKNDFGDYPPSTDIHSTAGEPSQYCGSELLAEAMFGLDLLGFHPKSKYEYNNASNIYDTTDVNLKQRKEAYVSRENMGVFFATDIFKPNFKNTGLWKDNYLICDVYAAVSKTITLSSGQSTNKFKIGTPILYFRANTSALDISTSVAEDKKIYNVFDNLFLIEQGRVADQKPHDGFIDPSTSEPGKFYDYIRDEVSSTTARPRPVRPDSFLLISAGADGLYGTSDDICNFTPNL